MAKISFASLAYADAEKIFRDLTAYAGVAVAERYDKDFKDLFRRLAQFPRSGAPRPALGALVRIGVVEPYVIAYEYAETDNTVTVMRIVHGRRNITRRLLRERAT
jgi:plasmid stabilization system protein ParE